MTLDQVQRGQKIRILAIPQEEIRAQAIRFGISIGAEVACAEKIMAGPIVLAKGKQEIAIGRRLAENIKIALA